jgi:hypothetical protein
LGGKGVRNYENCGKAATQLAFTINMKSSLRWIRAGESNGAKESSPLSSEAPDERRSDIHPRRNRSLNAKSSCAGFFPVARAMDEDKAW